MKLGQVDYLKVRMICIQQLEILVTLEDGAALEFQYLTEAELSRDFEARKGDQGKSNRADSLSKPNLPLFKAD